MPPIGTTCSYFLRVTYRQTLPAVAMFAVLLVASCGGSGDETTDDPSNASVSEESAGEASAPDQAGGSSDEDSGGASPEGLCVAVLSVDLSAAFDQQLEFGEANDVTGREMCTVVIEGAEGEGLIVKVTSAENYELKAAYEDEGLPFTEIESLGEEAFIVNEADLNVLLDDNTALAVSLQGFWVDGSPPAPAVVEAGLVDVAEAIIASR